MRHGLLFVVIAILTSTATFASDTDWKPELAPDPTFTPANPWYVPTAQPTPVAPPVISEPAPTIVMPPNVPYHDPHPGQFHNGPFGNEHCDGHCGSSLGPYWMGPSNSALPRYYVTGEALWLSRSRDRGSNLTFDDTTRNWVMGSDDFDFDMTSGARIMIGKFINPQTAIEGGYYGFHDWNETESRSDTNNLTAYWDPQPDDAFFAPAFNLADNQSATYSSSLHNAELGIRRWINPRASFLFGVRYIKFEDDFALHTQDAGTSGVYSVEGDNDLLGLQIGGEWTRPVFHSQRWFVMFDGRAGLFLNFAEQDSRLADNSPNATNGGFDDTRGEDRTGFASVLDLALSLNWKISDRIVVRGGYRTLFMTGLALAPDNLDTNPAQGNSRQSLDNNGSVFLGGPFVGGTILLY